MKIVWNVEEEDEQAVNSKGIVQGDPHPEARQVLVG